MCGFNLINLMISFFPTKNRQPYFLHPTPSTQLYMLYLQRKDDKYDAADRYSIIFKEVRA